LKVLQTIRTRKQTARANSCLQTTKTVKNSSILTRI
jgi:hypothetical protein